MDPTAQVIVAKQDNVSFPIVVRDDKTYEVSTWDCTELYGAVSCSCCRPANVLAPSELSEEEVAAYLMASAED